jgi:hypothetical protein
MPANFSAPAKSSSPSSTASSTPKSTPKPTNTGVSASKIINAIAFHRAPAHRDSADDKKKSKSRNLNQITTPSDSKRTTQGLFTRVSARDIENEKPIATFTSLFKQGKPNQSIFEKVNPHGGSTTYLGTGTFSELEDCIRDCLSKNKSHVDLTNYNTKHDYKYKSLTRASVLEDYSYDGVLTPKYHISIPVDTHPHHHHHHHLSDHKKHAAELSLEEIRQVNDALAKYGIPVFSYPAQPYNREHPVGDVISVCKQLLADHAHRPYGDAQHAVQHVWDNLQHHSPQTNIHGYASPAVQGVASHLFHPNQPPYSPVQSAASHLFGNAPQNPYNPGQGMPPPPYGYPPQGSNNPGQSAISRLFGNPQPNPYNPGQGPPPPPPPPPPPQPPYGGYPQQSSGSPGQSVLSRLFGQH